VAGDAAAPSDRRTFVAGTFCHHPLAMAATAAVLAELEAHGAERLAALNATTEEFCARLDRVFAERDLPVTVDRFGSLFKIKLPPGGDLLFPELWRRGVYAWEGRTCFLSTAHAPADLDAIVDAIAGAADRLRDAGVLVPVGAATAEAPAIPLLPAQRRFVDPAAPAAANFAFAFEVPALDVGRLRAALVRITARHEALRIDRLDGDGMRIGADARVALDELAVAGDDPAATAALRALAEPPFALDREPPTRWRLARRAGGVGDGWLLVAAHRAALDGWSMGLVVGELLRLYDAPTPEAARALGPPTSLARGLAQLRRAGALAPDDDAAATHAPSAAPARWHHARVAPAQLLRTRAAAAAAEASLHAWLVACVIEALPPALRPEGPTIRIGTPVAGQPRAGVPGLALQASEVHAFDAPSNGDRGARARAIRGTVAEGLGRWGHDHAPIVVNLDAERADPPGWLRYAASGAPATSHRLVVNAMVVDDGPGPTLALDLAAPAAELDDAALAGFARRLTDLLGGSRG
jgi:hypothetical protein